MRKKWLFSFALLAIVSVAALFVPAPEVVEGINTAERLGC